MKSQFSCGKACLVLCSLFLGSSLYARNAAAEKILAHDGDWTVYSDGRVGAFASYTRGDGYPNPRTDAAGQIQVQGGGMVADMSQNPPPATIPTVTETTAGTTTQQLSQGQIERMRFRSGMIANTFGFGVRGPLTEHTSVKGYIQIWAWVENLGEDKTQLNNADVRQGYVKLEGGWGSLLLGRSRGLFARGNTDNDVLYAHGFGVGYAGAVDSNGPTQGQIGFGILGSGFCSGVVYGSPVIGGLQLNIGAFDPVKLNGAWTRTKWPRPEAELTYQSPTFAKTGKVVLFVNGVYERLYQTSSPDSAHVAAKGIAYGLRAEWAWLRLGLAGHYGQGLGLNYALEPSAAAVSQANSLRWIDGYAVQPMVVLGKVDVFAGWGITRVFLSADDLLPYAIKTSDSADQTVARFNVIKYQQGISFGALYHVRPWLHVDVDVFRANFAWFLGDTQVDWIANAGMMLTW